MADKQSLSMQDTFINHVSEHNTPVTIFLMNGVKLQGRVTHHDKFGVALTRDQQTQYVYKRAISTISPLMPIRLYEAPDGEMPE